MLNYREYNKFSYLYTVCLKTIEHLNLKLWIFSGHTACFRLEDFQDFGNFELSPMNNHYAKYRVSWMILAHRIRIFEILPWDRKSYLTHAILPRLSREGNIHWLYWNSCTLWSSDVIVMLKWCHHVKLYLSLFRVFWKLCFFFIKKRWWARKRIRYSCEGRTEKSVPRDHCLSSLGMPRDA